MTLSTKLRSEPERKYYKVHQLCRCWDGFIHQVYVVYRFSTQILWSAPPASGCSLVVL